MRMLFDMSSVMWTCLSVGNDVDSYSVNHNGKDTSINTAEYGFNNSNNLMLKALEEYKLTPKDAILVFEGRDSKKRRCMIEPTYKGGTSRAARAPEAYIEFNNLKERLLTTWRNLGAIGISQDFVEGDDTLAWLADNMHEDVVIVTNDNDMIVLNKENKFGSKCFVRVNGAVGVNKYGDFSFGLVTLYKCTVGDSGDNIKGAKGFGPAAFLNLIARYDDDGCFELLDLIKDNNRDALAVIAKDNDCKFLDKLVDEWESVYRSYRLCMLHPEWVNTIRSQVEWFAGMTSADCEEQRLKQWRQQKRLVGSSNYAQALEFLKSKVTESPFFSIDFETTTPPESDDWLEARGKSQVDVISSTIVSCGLNFGSNLQYGFYISVNHADSDNCSMEQLAVMLEALPKNKLNIAHNAAGFELPVAYRAFGERWKNNGWRGFIPNMVDTRIAASYWDENQPSHGLKPLSKLLLNYDQTTYEEVTSKSGPLGSLPRGGVSKKTYPQVVKPAVYAEAEEGAKAALLEPEVTEEWETRQYKMHELTAQETVAYGLDDVYTASGLWNFFQLVMQLENTFLPFMRLEQKPMYLSALAYVQGIKVDIPRLKALEKKDQDLADECWKTIEAFLIEKGWDGVTCPVFSELSPANIKEAVKIVTGTELTTMVRTQSKLAILVGQVDHPEADSLAKFIEDDRVDLVNSLIARHYTGKPEFNVGSPKQISKLLYEVIGLPIRLRNKPTEAMRVKGIREGNPRTDDGAIDMAVKFGDTDERGIKVLKALLESKSCNTRAALYWKAYPLNIHHETGRMHPEVRQSGTNTRRWTGSNPNIMQMESDENGVRSVIQADYGYVFASLDESSQEVRQLAQFSRDPTLAGCYVGESKRDTHSIVGKRIAGVSYEEFIAMRKSSDSATAKMANDIRQKAKITLFSVIYGAMAGKVGETLGISESEAQKYIDAIFDEFPGIKEYKEASEKEAESVGWVLMEGGTRRHLAKLVTSEDRWESSKALRQAGNARIQGSGANQLKTVMTDIWESDLLDNYDYKWVFPCHDETCHQVGRKDATVVLEKLHGFMTKQFLADIPSESSIGVGLNYGQLVELEKPLAALGVGFDAGVVQNAVDELFV